MPDSPLYGLKLASEDARLWFVFDDKREAEILLDQSNERIDEITTMVSRGEPVPEKALSALQDRNDRAAAILLEHSKTQRFAQESSHKLRSKRTYSSLSGPSPS